MESTQSTPAPTQVGRALPQLRQGRTKPRRRLEETRCGLGQGGKARRHGPGVRGDANENPAHVPDRAGAQPAAPPTVGTGNTQHPPCPPPHHASPHAALLRGPHTISSPLGGAAPQPLNEQTGAPRGSATGPQGGASPGSLAARSQQDTDGEFKLQQQGSNWLPFRLH